MYLGNIVEICDRKTLFKNAQHPYTKALLFLFQLKIQNLKETTSTYSR